MLATVFYKLKYSTLEPTSMCLQLVDQSVQYPFGIVENIQVKIREFFVPVDFVVLDMQLDSKVSIILGRPFLSTANAHIDVGIGEIKFTINGKEERFAFKSKAEHVAKMAFQKNQEESSEPSTHEPKTIEE